ncbi:MAG: hypothetical protein KIS30_01315 [Thermoplasmata archaeon]|nr:hypothetical protein [Candidatus Sysuiplasma acidicola]MBX8637977.1 hypothetical protein [Candidatus Sysuiplasma acidicola]MBX8645388.1 hypothetical protein [Candidatus Sysuiplasma acidicola]MDH2905827.1 tRNA 4-thiouridine(8) synthase ThiI [Methanomassiliicoccales archaeon]
MTFIDVKTTGWHMQQESAGRAVCLISGGIDSPVAAWLTMRSGIRLDLVHFHSYPFSCTSAIQKAKELSGKLLPLQGGGKLHLVPFLDLQEAVFRNTPNSLRIVIYRRAMARIAEKIANRLGASFLVTGDSLGQVSSQTLQNLATVDQAVKMPILRPLIGFDKAEIISAAKGIDTYEISIRPHEDCCTLFSLGNPATRTTAARVEIQEQKVEMRALIDRCVEAVETIPIGIREN